ncbi:DNA excision repair protein ERCC-1 isoform X2 [Phaenicophaeus curvirostris]|uniref:DNA excision repair protein ERCC-1 isoform X2 n=1 Tax=Phaenicophaeus curvirostris TaxID=33595 RepID=UPI0037F0AF22
MEAKGGAGGGSRFRLREESPDRTPVPSLFKASAAPPPAPPPVSGPSSYADFVVQRAVAPPAPDPPKPVQVTPPNPEPGGVGGVGAELPPLPAIKPGAKSSSIIVSPRQRGNPVLRFVRNVPWEFGDVVPDYVLGQSTCALFLSLRYHHLHPDYIHERLRLLGRSYELRVLLLQKDPLQALKDLAKVCILADCTLLLAWSPPRAPQPRGGRPLPGDVQILRAEASGSAEGTCRAGFSLADERLSDQRALGQQDGRGQPARGLRVPGLAGRRVPPGPVPVSRHRPPEGEEALRRPPRPLPAPPQPQNLLILE